jgi:hypothetical protein
MEQTHNPNRRQTRLGVCDRHIRVLTNIPDKIAQFTPSGVTVSEQVPPVVGIGRFNGHNLETKRVRRALLPEIAGAVAQTRKAQNLEDRTRMFAKL